MIQQQYWTTPQTITILQMDGSVTQANLIAASRTGDGTEDAFGTAAIGEDTVEIYYVDWKWIVLELVEKLEQWARTHFLGGFNYIESIYHDEDGWNAELSVGDLDTNPLVIFTCDEHGIQIVRIDTGEEE